MKPIKLLTSTIGAAILAGGWAGGLQAAITDNLVAHLTFDDTFNDASGHGINGTAVGAPYFSSGILGKAVSLTTKMDGSQFDYVTLGYPELLKFGADVDFTVCFWAKYTNQVDDPAFIANKDWGSSNNQGWIISTQGGGNFRVNVTDDGGSTHKQNTTSTPNIRDGTWHHVAVTFARKGDVTIYVDGKQVTTSPMTMVTGSIDTDLAVNIGQDGTGVYTDGGSAEMVDVMMDDLGIWRRVLSSGEVSAIYDAGKQGKTLAEVPAIVDPYVATTVPAPNATGVAPNATISAVIMDGLNAVAADSIQLIVNGAVVPATTNKVALETTVQYTTTPLLPSAVTTVSVVFGNNAKPQARFTNTWSFTSTYVTLAPNLKVTPDTSKPGFIWNIFANQANQVNSSERTEAALAGQLQDADGQPLPNLADPAAQGAAIAPSTAPNPANAPIQFAIASVINLSRVGGDNFGNFTPDDQMPGVPATDTSDAGLAVEILTCLELPAGLTIMGVNSDDGFRTTAGLPQDALSAIRVGEYSGGRGSGDTTFMIVAPEAGVYAFRTSYENGSSDANIEWFTLSGTNKVLVNDVAKGGIKAYRASTGAVQPYVKTVQPAPAPRQLPETSSSVVVVLDDGDKTIDDNSIALKLDGNPVTLVKSRQGKTVTVTYAPTTLQVPDEQHTAELTFKDSTGAFSRTEQWTFYNLKNLVLPAPVLTENFDAYAEGSVPTGWTAWNFTDTDAAGEDLDNLHSDSYKGWIVVSRTRLEGLKARIFNVAPGQTFNGQPVTVDTLSTGNLLYAETDVRSGNQVQFIITKPFDLSKVTNVVLTLSSLYEQNQDNINALEYSVDGGTNWLPLVYYIDYADSGGDIKLNPDGSVDAVRTLTDPNTDTAYWTDNGVQKGGKYGDGIAAPITQALALFIAPRLNDAESSGNHVDKRIEVFRLPQAGKKSDVRLRFAQIGTASWYWGVHNVAFYEGPPPATPPTQPKFNAPTIQGGNVVISWTGTGTLQQADAVTGTSWSDAPNQSNPQNVTPTGPAKFYRIKQ